MKRLTSQQRKLIYLGGIVALMIPIIFLGAPATTDRASGGALAKMRAEHNLGEATLGDVDPTSATMNLVLLGLRGIAADLLWVQAHQQKQQKDWAQLRTTVNSITLLQPHYTTVWEFQGWNLAYNVSVEWDDLRDRFYWIKEGAKFLDGGIEKNKDVPDLYYHKATIVGRKIGYADEWRYYREFFKHDPDSNADSENYPDTPAEVRIGNSTWELYGPDKELNPEGKDNYLVAKDIYEIANEKELLEGVEQHVEARFLFRCRPARAQIGYALALHREGKFGEVARQAWEQAYRDWTEQFGRERFNAPVVDKAGNQVAVAVPMDPTGQDLTRLAEEHNVSVEALRRHVMYLQKTSNYRYWKHRADAERRGETEEAHRELYLAKKAFFEGRVREAESRIMSGLEKYEKVFNQYFQNIKDDRDAINEGLEGVLLMHRIYELRNEPVPDDYPLKSLWERAVAETPNLRSRLQRKIDSEAGILF